MPASQRSLRNHGLSFPSFDCSGKDFLQKCCAKSSRVLEIAMDWIDLSLRQAKTFLGRAGSESLSKRLSPQPSLSTSMRWRGT